MPTTSALENPSGMDPAVAHYQLHSLNQVFKEEAALVLTGPPPPHDTQLPLYTPKLGTSSPTAGPQYTYLKLLSLIPSFKPPKVYAVMETVTAEMMQQLGTMFPTQPSTPLWLGVWDPANPTFSNVLWIRREKDIGEGPPLPHTGPSRNGPPRPPPPPGPSRDPSH